MSVRLLERETEQKEFDPIPADGSAPRVNPPPLRWLLQKGVAAWRVQMQGPDGKSETFGPVSDPVLPLPRPLKPGSWRWQYTGLDRDGREVGAGRERTFIVKPGLPGVCIPDMAALERRVAGLPQRLFGKRIESLKRRRPDTLVKAFNQLEAYCRLAEQAPSIPEPAPYGLHTPDSEAHNRDWIRIYSAGKSSSAHAMRLALSYLLTGNNQRLEHAKRHAMNVLEWNPWGPTSMHTTDEAGMPILERLSLVYDWLRPHWTPEERRRYLTCMMLRGEEAMERNRHSQFTARPFNNHQCRTLAFQGLAGVAFLGEIPQASQWLQYVLNILAVSYPSASWGSDDGGWSQGLAYWAAYMSWLIEFVAAMKELDVDFAVAPYYANTGYFALYNLPTYSPRGGFGDHSENGPGISHKLVVGTLGALADDEHLQRYAADIQVKWTPARKKLALKPGAEALAWDSVLVPDVLSLLLLPESEPKQQKVEALPAARQFPNIGWASMHSALGDAARDTWLQFKSSPYGSLSHSHADQNSFNLFAFGEALLIDSGYYPWYGSPHDTLWTRQSWAHNMVLIDGRGQPPFDWFARGNLAAFCEAFPFCYSRGEAAQAYNRPAKHGMQELARKHSPALIKKMGPAAETQRASRAVMMVAGKTPFYIVADALEVSRPVKFQWLAHAFQKMKIHSDSLGFDVHQNKAHLAVRFASPAHLKFSQHDRFPIAPEGRAKGQPNQWHLQAETKTRSRAGRFLAVMVPYRAAGKAPEIQTVQSADSTGFRIGADTVLAPRKIDSRRIQFENISADGTLAAICGDKIFVAEATRLEMSGRVLFESQEPQSITLPLNP